MFEDVDIGLGKFRAVHILLRHGTRNDLIAVALEQFHRTGPDAKAQIEQLFALHAVFLLLDKDKAVLALKIGLGFKIFKTDVESVEHPLVGRGGLRPDDGIAHVRALAQP